MRGSLRTAATPPVLGALLGGASVGLVESLHVLSQAFGTKDYSGVVQAVLLYGGAGLAVGLLLALLAVGITVAFGEVPEAARSWTVAWLVVFCTGAYSVATHVGARDFGAGAPVAQETRVALVVGLIAFSAVFYLFTRNALKKTFFSFLLHPLGTGGVYGALVAFTLLFAVGTMINNRADADVAPRPVAPSLLDRPNILLVVVDDLRADALDEGARLTPSLERLAREATVFERAFSHSPATRPALASVLSSSVPCAHRAVGPTSVLPDATDTLAEVLNRHGYTTGAVVTSVDATASFNFDQGFDTFQFLRPRWLLRASEASYRLALYQALHAAWEARSAPFSSSLRHYHDAPVVAGEAIDWLRRHGGERWFLMVQFRDPAEPFIEHPQLARATADPIARASGGGSPSGPDGEALYRGEVGWVDRGLGQLIDYMDGRDLLDTTAVVVTGLSGAVLSADVVPFGGLGDAELHVPLLLRHADADERSHRTVGDLVRHADIAPTLAQLAGAPEGAGWQGVSLLREYALRSQDDRLVFAESLSRGVPAVAVRDRDWKFVHREPSHSELYYLQEDPREVEDLARRGDAEWKVREKATQLGVLRSSLCVAPGATPAPDAPLSAEDCAVLRRLGYQEGFSERCGSR